MALVVGLNSFISVEEADNIINSNYLSTSDKRKYWEDLAQDDKEVLLIRASDILNSEDWMWIGKKEEEIQTLVFPRIDCRNIKIDIDNKFKTGLIKIVMQSVSTDTNEYKKLLSNGISSFSDGGGLSVKFSDTAISNSLNSENIGLSDNIFNNYFKHLTYLSF